jgi:hypothetical protein
MQSFRISANSKLFYNIKDMFEHKPTFFYGCTVKKRGIIQRKNIPPTEYVYANFFAKTKEWNLSDESCKKAQLLITKDWVDAHFVEPVKTDETDMCEDAPPMLTLDDSEKFKDEHGQPLDIEVRGERHPQKIFFKVQDVMVAFNLPRLNTVLSSNTENNYERGYHYKCFIRVQHTNSVLYTNKSDDPNKNMDKTLFLTYKGMLKVLFSSRGGNAEKFQDWAQDKLFTVQMGTTDQKEILGTEILNIKLDNYRAVFTKYSQSFSCIYLLSLGKVSALRQTFGIHSDVDGSLMVYKFGFTSDLKRRLAEHQRDYGLLPNVALDLEIFNYIDLKYTSEAEGDIRDIFDSFSKSIHVDGRNELVALTPKEFDRVKKEYTRTGREFAGASQVLQEEINKLMIEITALKHKNIMLETNVEMLKTKIETDAIIYKLKIENYELQLQLKK